MCRARTLVFAALAAALSIGRASADGVPACVNYPGNGPCVALTFYGNITSGTDNVGYFGYPGDSLSGDKYALTFGFYFSEADNYGGALGDGLLNATISIHGDTLSTQSYNGGTITLSGNNAEGFVYNSDGLSFIFSGGVNSANPFVPPQDYISTSGPPTQANFLTVPFSYDLQPGDSGGAGIYAGDDLAYCPPICGPVDTLAMSVNAVTLEIGAQDAPGPLPEPPTWMLTLIALGGLLLATQRVKPGFRFGS